MIMTSVKIYSFIPVSWFLMSIPRSHELQKDETENLQRTSMFKFSQILFKHKVWNCALWSVCFKLYMFAQGSCDLYTVWGQNVGAIAKCLLSVSMSGLVSAVAIFVTLDKLSFRNPWKVAGNTALLCLTIYMGVGKWLHMWQSPPALGEPQGFSRVILTNTR